jgi:hypothetical protein
MMSKTKEAAQMRNTDKLMSGAWHQVKAGDIARAVAHECGLEPGNISDGQEIDTFVAQVQPAYAILDCLAEACGGTWQEDDKGLTFIVI